MKIILLILELLFLRNEKYTCFLINLLYNNIVEKINCFLNNERNIFVPI